MSHAQGKNTLISYIGGVKKTFRFDPGTQGSKQAAERARIESDNQIRAAIQSRAQQVFGRNATERELRTGLKLPDTRPIGQQVREDAKGSNANGNLVADERGFLKRDPADNFYRLRIAALEDQLARAPRNLQEPIRKRIAQLVPQAEHFDSVNEAKRLNEARLAEIADLVALNQGWLSLLSMSPDGADQEYLEAAQKAHLELIRTGDREAYFAATDAWQTKRRDGMTERAKLLDTEAARLKELADGIRDLRSEKPAEPSEAETPATEPA